MFIPFWILVLGVLVLFSPYVLEYILIGMMMFIGVVLTFAAGGLILVFIGAVLKHFAH